MINESKILELIKRQKETGLTIKAFCANEGIPKSSYYYWRKKLERKPDNRFIPLLVNPTQTQMSRPSKNNQDYHEHHTTCDDFHMELIYVNGTRLKIKGDPDLDQLRSLVCLLG
jgi:ssDNA-binding Zn-finger/Zn-ribbon topoisomerase 1